MYVRLMTFAASLFLSVSIYAAEITLQVPEHFELLSINGKDVKGNFAQRARQYTLNAGETVLELRYNDIQEASVGDSHTVFRSNPVGVRFSAETDHRYALKASRPDNEKQAAAFVKDPQLSIVDMATATPVPQQFLNSVDFKKGILTAATQAVSTPANTPAVVKSNSEPPSDLISQNLWFWWQQADEPTRSAFLKRIAR